MARQHHDFQREGSAVGYYYPGGEPKTDSGNTLLLTHENLYNHDISDKRLIDDKIIEVDWEGIFYGAGEQVIILNSLDLTKQQKMHCSVIHACRAKPAATGCTSTACPY